MKPKDEQLSEALHLAAHGWRTALDRRLRPLGYSRSRWMVLLHVSRCDGISHRLLSERLGIEAATLVRLVDRMEEEGLLKRSTDACDRRVKHLHMLAAGRKEVERIWESASRLRHEILSGFTEVELNTTFNVLQIIRGKLETLE